MDFIREGLGLQIKCHPQWMINPSPSLSVMIISSKVGLVPIRIAVPMVQITSSYSTIECSPESFMRTTRARGKPLELPNVQEATLEYNLKKKLKINQNENGQESANE